MKTLTELKRTLKPGQYLTMRACNFDNKLVGIKRKITKVNSEGFALETVKNNGSICNSHMDWPKATGFKLIDDGLFEFRFTYDTLKTDSFLYHLEQI